MSEWVDHKVPAYGIRRLTNADEGFYDLVGPYLSRRHVVRELGSSVWDDDRKVWYLAVTTAEPEVIGMVAEWHRTVCSFWVPPATRGQAVGYALLRYLVTDFGGSLTTVCTDDSLPLFEAAGFRKLRERGRFHVCSRAAEDGVPDNA